MPGAGLAGVFCGSSAISGKRPRYLRATSAIQSGYSIGNMLPSYGS